jgi:hypothetical protein
MSDFIFNGAQVMADAGTGKGVSIAQNAAHILLTTDYDAMTALQLAHSDVTGGLQVANHVAENPLQAITQAASSFLAKAAGFGQGR